MKASLTLQTIACLLVSLVQAAQLTISIPSSHILENPSALPPSTHATLLGPNGQLRRALLTRSNTLSFPSLPVGAHLLNIHSRDYIFAPLRVDVLPSTTAEGTAEIIEVHQTFRGNEWSNKGQKYGSAKDKLVIAIPPTGKRDFYMSRGGFDLMSFFKNPMILIGIASMGLVFGMPYLMDNSTRHSKAIIYAEKLIMSQWMRRPRLSSRRCQRSHPWLRKDLRMLCRILILLDSWPGVANSLARQVDKARALQRRRNRRGITPLYQTRISRQVYLVHLLCTVQS